MMFDQVEEFYRPINTREVLRLLQNYKGEARLVAGGTDIVPGDGPSPRVLIDLTAAGLNYIRQRNDTWTLGATTTMAELEQSPAMRQLAGGILARAASTCGSVQIRNIATIGGNMAHGSPAAELATALLTVDAMVNLAGAERIQRFPLAEYLAEHRTLRKLLLTDIVIAPLRRSERSAWSFQKLSRTALDISIVNAAIALQLDSQNIVTFARVALGAVAPCALRIPAAERILVNHKLTAGLLDKVCGMVARRVRPIDDLRASAGYRREMSAVLVRRALEDCAAQLECSL